MKNVVWLRWKIGPSFFWYFLSDERLIPVLSQTRTFGFALKLHSPSVYQTFPRFAVISFTWFSSLLSPFIPSVCMPCRAGGKQRWNPVIKLFFIHAVFPCKYEAIKCKLNSAAGRHRGFTHSQSDTAGTPHNPTFVPVTFFLPFKPKHTSYKQP